jgi:hypothetical protein
MEVPDKALIVVPVRRLEERPDIDGRHMPAEPAADPLPAV